MPISSLTPSRWHVTRVFAVVGAFVVVPACARSGEPVEVKYTPKEIREQCRNMEAVLRALDSPDTAHQRYLFARRELFETAHAAALKEIRQHIAEGHLGMADTVANTHQLEWYAAAGSLGDVERAKIGSLRESCRLLPLLFADWSGPPEPAPPPRTRAVAPAPRPKP